MPFTKMKNCCAPIFSKEKKSEMERSFNYNVLPKYKPMTKEEIIKSLAQDSLDYAVCMQNFSGDFNISTFIRNANAFGAKEVFYVGKRKIDKRGCQGTNIYKKITWIEEEEQLLAQKANYHFVAVDILPGSIPIQEYTIKPNTMFIFGSEAEGLLPSIIDMCDESIHIPQRGSVPSINVGCAGAVIMHYAESQLSKLK